MDHRTFWQSFLTLFAWKEPVDHLEWPAIALPAPAAQLFTPSQAVAVLPERSLIARHDVQMPDAPPTIVQNGNRLQLKAAGFTAGQTNGAYAG